jgi:hypothetical protein
MAGTMDQSALILSKPRRRPRDETQETLRTTQFPSQHVKVEHKTSGIPPCFASSNQHVFLVVPLMRAGEVGKEPLPCWGLLWANRGLT